MTVLQELAQLGGTLATVVLFLFYLNKKDELNKKTYDEFNTTINNHLDHSTKVIKENNEVITKIAVALKELCIIIKGTKRGVKIK
jgi:hypothetical protein